MITRFRKYKSRFMEVDDALYRYQSLDQDDESLYWLMANKPQLLVDYARETRDKLSRIKRYQQPFPVTRGQGLSHDLADYCGGDFRIDDNSRITSWADGPEPAREFAKAPLIVTAYAEPALVFYHHAVCGGGLASESEVIFLDCDIVMDRVNCDTDSDTGRRFITRQAGRIVKRVGWRW